MATAIGDQDSRGSIASWPARAGWVALAAMVAGCGGYDSYVKTDDAALGRVVIYRNGIAYFERKAHVTGGELAIDVPEDKVNDFLKSLTVADAKTGKALPVSFPTRRGTRRPARGAKSATSQAKPAGTAEMVVQPRIARRRQQLAANESRIRKLAEDLKKKGQRVVIEGHAAEAEPKPDAQTGKAPMTDAAPVGESHFESRTALTFARGTSAMVSVVHDTTEGEIVYLYEPDGKRGDRRYAFRAVRFRNPTDSTLEAQARDEGGADEGGAVEGGAVAGGADEGADRKATAHPLAEPLRALAKLQRERERLREEILGYEARRREFHARARELHVQIASLQLVRTARNLTRHIERKMKDATDRVQDATVAIVDRKEALMLARIKFEDELAELRWSAPSAEKT